MNTITIIQAITAIFLSIVFLYIIYKKLRRYLMPTINKRKICNKHGLYNAIESPSCPKCKKVSDKTYDTNIRAKDRAKIYNNKKWKTVREKAILRANMMCEECHRNGIDTLGEEVDHIIELADDISLAYELSNLQYLCKSCHAKKTRDEKNKRNKNFTPLN